MNLHRQQGVILIEAMIGILIFSIGILALIGMQGTAVKNATDARYRSDAAYLANRMAAQLRLDFANLSSYPDSYTPGYQPRTDWRTQVQATLPGVDLAGSQRVPSITITPGPTFAGDSHASSQAVITILWQQPGGSQPHTFQLVTYVAKYELLP
jgi:type IV pilus assembly protein PilV